MKTCDVDWATLRAANDPSLLPKTLHQMFNAQDLDAARASRNEIEFVVCPNRELYEAAYPVVHVLAEAITGRMIGTSALTAALDLLIEISLGELSRVEQVMGNWSLVANCRTAIRKLLPALYANRQGTSETLLAVVDLAVELEESGGQLAECRKLLSAIEPGPQVQRAARNLESRLEVLATGSLIRRQELPCIVRVPTQVFAATYAASEGFLRLLGFDIGSERRIIGLNCEFTSRPGVNLPSQVRIECSGIERFALKAPFSLAPSTMGFHMDSSHSTIWIKQEQLEIEAECKLLTLIGSPDLPDYLSNGVSGERVED